MFGAKPTKKIGVERRRPLAPIGIIGDAMFGRCTVVFRRLMSLAGFFIKYLSIRKSRVITTFGFNDTFESRTRFFKARVTKKNYIMKITL